MGIADASKLHHLVLVKGEIAALGMSVTPTINLLYYRRTAIVAPLNQANLITAFHTAVKASWKAAASSSWTWLSTMTRCIDDATDAGTLTVVTEAGGVAGECMPTYNAQLISKACLLRGKSYRGRVFFPSVPEGSADGNTLTAGGLALLVTVADKLDDGFTDADGNPYVPVVFSAKLSQVVTNPTTVTTTDISACTAHDPVTSLKRRKRKA